MNVQILIHKAEGIGEDHQASQRGREKEVAEEGVPIPATQYCKYYYNERGE